MGGSRRWWWLRGQTFSGEWWLLRASLVSCREREGARREGLDAGSLWYWLVRADICQVVQVVVVLGTVGVAIARDGLGVLL